MKKYILILVIIFTGNICKGQDITIEFSIDGKKKCLDNNFKCYFVYQDSTQKIIYKPTINKDKIIISSLIPRGENIKYHIIFEYRGRAYYICYDTIFMDRTIGVAFHKHGKYFKEVKMKIHDKYYKEVKKNKPKLKGLLFYEYGSSDIGRGTYIYDLKSYFQKGRDYLVW